MVLAVGLLVVLFSGADSQELAKAAAAGDARSQRAHVGPEIFDRLLNLLGEIPARGSALGEPRVPGSGRWRHCQRRGAVQR